MAAARNQPSFVVVITLSQKFPLKVEGSNCAVEFNSSRHSRPNLGRGSCISCPRACTLDLKGGSVMIRYDT